MEDKYLMGKVLVNLSKLIQRKLKNLNFKHEKSEYDDLLLNDYGITSSSLLLSSLVVAILIFISLEIIITLFKLSPLFHLVNGFIMFFLINYNKNYFNRYYFKKGLLIDSMMFMITSNYNLFSNFLPENMDRSLILIHILQIPAPLHEDFTRLKVKIQNGCIPEYALSSFKTPSKLLSEFLHSLLISNFKKGNINSLNKIETLENRFKQYTKSIEARLSIIFFIGIFFPIGLGFLTILQKLNSISLFLSLISFILLMKFIYSKFIKNNSYLLGISLYEDKEIQKEFIDFTSFLIYFTNNLYFQNTEISLINAYNSLNTCPLKNKLSPYIIQLKNYTISIDQFFKEFNQILKSTRSAFLLETIHIMLNSSSINSYAEINNILKILNEHKILEQERLDIIKGEGFKVKIFQMILPFIIGLISGIFPIISKIYSEYSYVTNQNLPIGQFFYNPINLFVFILIELIILIISSYYFNKITFSDSILSYILVIFIFLIALFFSFYYLQNISSMSLNLIN